MLFIIVFGACLLLFLYCKLVKLSYGYNRSSQHLVGKVAIVTGSNTGIGYETAKDFAARGAKVILACRSEIRANKARDEIISATGNKQVYVYKLDLSSFKSVREFVDNFTKNEKRLDILVNNAGDIDLPIMKTEDGLLLGMQVNYFGPFLLTNLLLPVLKNSAPSRIVNVASTAYKIGKVDIDNLNAGKDGLISQVKLYGTAKLCTILMTVELGKQLEGTGVTANALCPGFVYTNIMTSIRNPFWRFLFVARGKMTGKDWWEGAQTQIYLSVAPEVEHITGNYFTECKKVKLEKFACDPDISKKLWEATENLVKTSN